MNAVIRNPLANRNENKIGNVLFPISGFLRRNQKPNIGKVSRFVKITKSSNLVFLVSYLTPYCLSPNRFHPSPAPVITIFAIFAASDTLSISPLLSQ